MNTTHVIGVIALGFASAAGLSSAAPRPDEAWQDHVLEQRIDALEDRLEALITDNHDLRRRVVALEARQPTGQPAQSARWVIRVDSVEAAPVDAQALRRAEALLEQAEDFQAQADSIERRIAAATQSADERRTLQDLMENYRREAERHRRESLRLGQEARAPRQIIRGGDGARQIILRTDRDLSAVVTQVGRGGFVTWEGIWIETRDDGTEVFSVHRIEPASAAEWTSSSDR